MNYSNSLSRERLVGPILEKLRSRRHSTRKRVISAGKTRPAKTRAPLIKAALGLAITALFIPAASAEFIIEGSAGPFIPSFRDTSSSFDAGNTTWFGWTGNIDEQPFSPDDNGFDGPTPDEFIDAPPVIVGIGGLDGTLNQVGEADMLTATNNVFAGSFINGSFEAHLTLEIPTNGVPGVDGFSTIIIQGVGQLTGGGQQIPGMPGAINGVSPVYVSDFNANGDLQWWAKYELPGNASEYIVDIAFAGGEDINPGHLTHLYIDTQFSTTGFAPDIAVPEPGSAVLLSLTSVLAIARRRRPETIGS